MHEIQYPVEGVTYASPASAAAWLASGAWHDSSVGDCLRRTARALPDRPAFISDERTITFAELDKDSERLAAALLTMGLRPADRVILQLGTTVETVIAVCACYKAALIPICAIPQHREIEIGQLARLACPRGYLVQADFSSFDLVGFAGRMMAQHETIEHVIVVRGGAGQSTMEALIASCTLDDARSILAGVRPGPADVLSFQLSGGTTGVPKIIPRFHGEYLGHSECWVHCFGITPDSRLIWSLPLIHNAGQVYAMIPPLWMGLTVVLMARVDVRRMLELIAEHQVTHALSVGPVASQLIAYQDVALHDLSSLRQFAAMSRASALEAHLGVPCSNLFGITEGLVLGTPSSAPAFARHESQGWACREEDEIVLLNENGVVQPLGVLGELHFRGPSSLRGYFGAPDATKDSLTVDGFVRSGDMMRAHQVDGRLCYTFEGRIKDNINRGGEKISCEEVEALVSDHPAVADAKLVAMPDPIYGEKGCIYLMLRPGQEAPTIADLVHFLSAKGLAKFKCPERIEIVENFPVTLVGKLDKAALRRMITAQLSTEQPV